MALIKHHSKPFCPQQRSVHIFLEFGHQGTVGGEHNVLVLQFQGDQRLALAVMHKNVEIHAKKEGNLFVSFVFLRLKM